MTRSLLWLALLTIGAQVVAPRTDSDAPAGASETLEAHLEELQQRLPEGRFRIVVQSPFVVVGDEEPAQVERRAERTVRWAADHLKQLYVEKDPESIIDVWLFKDQESYHKNTLVLTNEIPSTRFGFYSRTHRALFMDISTGGGTLVHELVHPFVAANFPECPSWFNEGLASLYEQCGERDGQIRGFTNWRLRGLQDVIRKQELATFEELCATSDDEFYSGSRGDNYAQARYLCYFLQEQHLLQRFWKEFRSQVADDPTGYLTLQRVLGEDDMQQFQKRFEAFVLALKF